MIRANNIEKGMYLRINGRVYEVLEEEMITPGNEVAFIDVKLKNIFNRGVLTRTLNPLEPVEEVYIDTIDAVYLGEEDGFRCFRSILDGGEIRVKNSIAGAGMRFVRPGTIVIVRSCDGRAFGVDIPDLLRMLNDVDGDFVIRFMTSHPKNASKKLFDTIAECGKISRHIHLPVQSGSDRILKLMNRNYTREQYMELIRYARSVIPDVYFTSDIIVGFPGETEDEYLQTCSLIEEANYYATFSFIYSKREGTPAASMPDDTPHSVKAQRLNALNEIQRKVTEKLELGLVGTRQRGICTGILNDGSFECRINNNAEVTVTGSAEVNSFCDITITDYINRRLYGKAE